MNQRHQQLLQEQKLFEEGYWVSGHVEIINEFNDLNLLISKDSSSLKRALFHVLYQGPWLGRLSYSKIYDRSKFHEVTKMPKTKQNPVKTSVALS